MFAMLLDKDKNFVWSQVPDPVRKERDVLIEVRAAALNRADLMQREGNYPPPPGWPQWPGLEVAGVVRDRPADSRWRVGQKVCALLGGGGYAELAAVPESMVLPIPENLSMEEAAGIPEVFATAYLNLSMEGALQPGETVFIQAGASGLGLAAIQLAKSIGARVVTTVGSEAKARAVRQFGADVVVNRRQDDLAAALCANPPSVALDCVAGPELGKWLELMEPGGRWIVVASLGGGETMLDMGKFFRRGIRLIGSTLRSRSVEMKAQILSGVEKNLFPAFRSGQIKSVVHRTLPIRQVHEAHAILQRRENIGKVILQLPGDCIR